MANNYYLKAVNSDLTGGSDFSLGIGVGTTTTGTQAFAVASSATETSYGFTDIDIPGTTTITTHTWAAQVWVTTANSNLTLAVQMVRVNSAGAVQSSSGFATGQVISTTGAKTFTIPSWNPGTVTSTDRLRMDFQLVNSAMSSQSCAFRTGADTYFTFTDTEFTSIPVGYVTPSAQYRSDKTTLAAIGGATLNDGKTYDPRLFLQADVSSHTALRFLDSTLYVEPEAIGTSFNNTANYSSRTMKMEEASLATARRGAVMGYDPVNRRFVHVGGYDGTTRFADVWEVDQHQQHAKIKKLVASTATNAPAGKNLGGGLMISNGYKSWFIYWGGSTGSDNNDMRILDCTVRGSEAWTLVTQTNTPAARSYVTHHMVANQTGTNTFDIYLFGGWGASRFNDLQVVTINMGGNVPTALTWTALRATGASGNPTIRSGAMCAWDSVAGRLLVHGGYSGTAYLTDTWSYIPQSVLGTYYFDGSTVAASDPNNVWTSDANAFAGTLNYPNAASCATNTAGTVSTNFLRGGGTNAPGTGGTITGVRARVYGGVVTTGATRPTVNAAVYTSALGTLLGTATYTSALNSDGWGAYATLSVPSGGWDWTKVQQLETKCFITAGSTSYNASVYAVQIDVLAGDTWTQLTPTGDSLTGIGRELMAGGYDATTQRIVYWGGWQGAIANDRNDVIEVDTSTTNCAYTILRAHTATNDDLPRNSAGCGSVNTWDNYICVFGTNGLDSCEGYYYVYPLSDTTRTNVDIYGLTTMDYYRAGDAPGYAINTARSEAVIICGFSSMDDDTTIANGDHHSQIWAYDYTNNKLRFANAGPYTIGPREGALVVYDSIGDRVLVFGGLTLLSQTINDIWELKADSYGNYVARRMKPSGTAPGRRWLMAGGFDSARNRIILWGGEDDVAVKTDMFQLDLSTGDGTWSSVTPTGTAPTGVWHLGYAYDDTNHILYVHGGGTNQSGSTQTAQAFKLDCSGVTPAWTDLAATSGTSARGNCLVVDIANSRLIRFGGYNGTVVNNTVQYLSTTGTGNAWATATMSTNPPARRSNATFFINSKFYITRGRPVSGQWFRDMWELTPNYGTPNSSTWLEKKPQVYQRFSYNQRGLLVDSYLQGNTASFLGGAVGDFKGFSQSFTASITGKLMYTTAYMAATAFDGSLRMKVYTHSGTYGTSSVPGTLLATSETITVATALGATSKTVNFKYSGADAITLTSGTQYCCVIEAFSASSTAFIPVTLHNASPTHGGNFATTTDMSTWSAVAGSDMIFLVAIESPDGGYHWQAELAVNYG